MIETKIAAPDRPEPVRTDDVRRLRLDELMAGARMLEIEHEGQIYRLTLTRQGKLILTK